MGRAWLCVHDPPMQDRPTLRHTDTWTGQIPIGRGSGTDYTTGPQTHTETCTRTHTHTLQGERPGGVHKVASSDSAADLWDLSEPEGPG